jgi:hypothetical protein
MDAADASDELDRLLSFVLPFAEQMLAREGGFHPFGAVLGVTGEIEPVDELPPTEHPDPEVLGAHLVEQIRARVAHGAVRACAICADVKVVPPDSERETDAVRVTMEHRGDPDAVAVFRPYTTGRRKLKFGELFAMRSPREILVKR